LTPRFEKRVLAGVADFTERPMTARAVAFACLIAGVAPILAAPPAQAQSCEELWYRRNSLYKQAGYCFRTARAIRTFGNAGCQYDSEADVPLSARQRAIVARIAQEERDLGCPR
jgi:YARHG domain